MQQSCKILKEKMDLYLIFSDHLLSVAVYKVLTVTQAGVWPLVSAEL